MGLVDYSDSDSSGSEADAPAKTAPKPAPKASQTSSKKPFQKVVDRSNPGRILVNLPQLSAEAPKTHGDEPPAKRARTGGSGAFSGFNSFLPAPKNANKPKAAPATTSAGQPKPSVNFKTSAAPGFSRSTGDDDDFEPSSGMSLPPPKAAAQPSIPEGQKPEEEVKLVGKPLMFKPLSVARTQKKNKKPTSAAMAKAAAQKAQAHAQTATETKAEPAPAPAPKKVSLFSMHTEEPSEPVDPVQNSGAYEPLFEKQDSANPYDSGAYDDYAQYASHAQTGPSATTAPGTESLDTIVNDMGLSAAAKRELFGRGGQGKHMAKNVINFNMDKEYEHNEEIRAAGEQQTHNPVRAIQGGKHSLRQLVQNVHNQKEALEDSFAKGKTNRKEASNKYGW